MRNPTRLICLRQLCKILQMIDILDKIIGKLDMWKLDFRFT